MTEPNDIGDTNVRYGGRTIHVSCTINTDEPIEAVILRVKAAAKGPKKCMVLIAGGLAEASRAAEIWGLVIPAAKAAAKGGG